MLTTKQQLLAQDTHSWETAQTPEQMNQVIEFNTSILRKWQEKNPPVFIMCPPAYFAIAEGEVAGNSFLSSGGKRYNENPSYYLQIMKSQWNKLKDTLIENGAVVLEMTPDQGLDDQVFTADPSQSYSFITITTPFCLNPEQRIPEPTLERSITVISNFAHPGRITESEKQFSFFKSLPTPVLKERLICSAKTKIEGTGDNLIDPYRGIILSGYGQRNAEESLPYLHKITGLPVYGVKSKPPFFHIDTYITFLPRGYVMYCPDVMTAEGVDELKQAIFKGDKSQEEKYSILVTKEEAEAFCCNSIILGEKVIMQHHPAGRLEELLKEKGFDVIALSPSADVFVANLSGGGPHCMTNNVTQPVVYNPVVNVARTIRNMLLEGLSQETISKKIEESTHDESELTARKLTLHRVIQICDSAAKTIQTAWRENHPHSENNLDL